MPTSRKQIFSISTCLLSLLSSLFWLALRINYSGISKFLGADTNQGFLIMNLPVMVCCLCWLGFGAAFLGLVTHRQGFTVFGFVVGVITALGACVVVYFGAWDYLSFILVHFWKSLFAAACLILLAWLLFCPVRPSRGSRWAIVGIAVLLTVILGYQIRPCYFTYGAVVYAVEDDYQIVFSTADSALGWVTIGDQEYYDLYAGSVRSADRVHKVTVPQTVLDEAAGYTIHAQQMIYRGPFGGYKGSTISKSYDFRPVSQENGLQYAALSDVHGAVDAAVKAAASDELDFLVLLGDLVSMVETESDAQFPNKLAHAITGGEIPVIYARGNHEIKGEYAEVLYKYVGSLNQGFAYSVTLGDAVFAAVLDMGEDHEDDWWEYYGTAKFDLYRQEQSTMLEDLLAAGDYQNYPYRMAICHIPIVYVDAQEYFKAFRQEWTELLNQLGMDISLSGHEHRVWHFLPGAQVPGADLRFRENYPHTPGVEPGGTVTSFTFPAFLCGQRSLAQTGGTQKWGLTDYLCLHTTAASDGTTQVTTYRNSNGDIVEIQYPFATDSQIPEDGKIIVTPQNKN